MPVTPFHFGVGILAKGAAPARVSLAAFVAAQVLIDCESGYYLFVAREWPVHRWAHTFVLASLIGLGAGILVWLASRLIFQATPETALPACLLGGLAGGVTRPFLDGIMHADIRPLMPFAPGNPFLGLIGLGALHLALVAAGVVGLALLAIPRARP